MTDLEKINDLKRIIDYLEHKKTCQMLAEAQSVSKQVARWFPDIQ